jgi:hypothetical protein
VSTYAPPVHVRHGPHVGLRLGVIIVLVAALVALGSWALVDRYAGGSGGATHNAATLIDKFYAAESAHDTAAIKALWTRNGVIWAHGQRLSVNELTQRWIHRSGVQVHRIAPVVAWGNFATTVTRFESPYAKINAPPMIQVVQMQNGKIFRLWEYFVGSRSPIINTAVAAALP